ncbi:hypothetical protein FHX82_002729 [Amycolatopsis bartoniae]|uniref:Uncharacterized protein n=1 Tax=Amycolatopsis bartoniae TaxID=941986 RepID=A0A8H9MAZ1_9PSEU|nr:hypothetical protein [Amycolatopsis bartoniae]MBB2935675.1 hypothetical protein [Amycolatopsis bartoniae]TVT02313.1 hypothetical protein FNH07_27555 [Amycolatopsis bartoniae]GHF61043.1 hypothetical protein GCM10017566_38040 [Amycolatopsis bartoniae]
MNNPERPDTQRLWETYRRFAVVRLAINMRCKDKAEAWLCSKSLPQSDRDRLWNEYEALCREYDIIDAKVCVARARYIVARHGLNESDIFEAQ